MPTIPNLPPDPNLPEYRWNARARRYVDARGRFVPQSVIKEALGRVLDDVNGKIDAESTALREGNISLAQWQGTMMGYIKDVHIIGGALQRGGWYNMSQSDFGRIGQITRQEYEFLRNFARQIANGEWPLDGRLNNRAALYGQAAWETYHRFARAQAQEDGFDEVQSVRNARDSCDDCIRLDGVWFKIGDPEYIAIGRRICKSNCRCSERYRKGKEIRIA